MDLRNPTFAHSKYPFFTSEELYMFHSADLTSLAEYRKITKQLIELHSHRSATPILPLYFLLHASLCLGFILYVAFVFRTFRVFNMTHFL